MKSSLILTFLILLAAGAIFAFPHGEADALRTKLTTLKAEAAGLGMNAEAVALGQVSDTDAAFAAATAATAETRAAHEAEIRKFASELIAFAREMKAMEKSGSREPDAEMQKRIVAMMSRFLDLDESDLRIVVDAVKSTSELPEDGKREIMGMTIMMLGQSNPEAGLRLFGEVRDFLGDEGGMAKQMAGMCLSSWAAKDPAAALAWANDPAHKDLATDDARRMLLTGAARKDPLVALDAFFQMPAGGEEKGTATMIGSQTPPEQRLALLNAIDERLPDASLAAGEREAGAKRIADAQKGILSGIAGSLTQGKFEESVKWIADSNLSDVQRDKLIDGIAGSLWGKDPVPWLTWMGENTASPEKLAERTQQIIPQWTRKDFNAVGEWLNVQPDGAMRSAATQSFAVTLAPHEPEAAARWALTLPDSPERANVLKTVYTQWKGKDAGAAAAFAAENGIAPE